MKTWRNIKEKEENVYIVLIITKIIINLFKIYSGFILIPIVHLKIKFELFSFITL